MSDKKIDQPQDLGEKINLAGIETDDEGDVDIGMED